MIKKSCPECGSIISIPTENLATNQTDVKAVCPLCGYEVIVPVEKFPEKKVVPARAVKVKDPQSLPKSQLYNKELAELERLRRENEMLRQRNMPSVPVALEPNDTTIYSSPQYYQPMNNIIGGKSNVTAGCLALFLGGLGVHKFYLNQPVLGIVYLIFCWTWIPAVVALVEAIIYFSSDKQEFARKHP